MQYLNDTELSSHEGTRCQFNGGTGAIKLGIDVHQDFYVVVEQVGGSNPKPPQRFAKAVFLHWAAKLKSQAREVYAVYEACGFARRLTCSDSLRERRLRLGAPSSSSSKWIALIKLLLRLRSQVRIGVGAAGKTKPTSNKEEEALQENPQPR